MGRVQKFLTEQNCSKFNFLMKKSVPSFRFCVHGTALYIPWSGTCRCAINDNSDGSNKNDLGRWLISANCAFRKFRSIGHRKTHFNGTELAEWNHDQSQMFCQFRIMRHTSQGALHPMGYGTTDIQNCETLVINCGFIPPIPPFSVAQIYWPQYKFLHNA